MEERSNKTNQSTSRGSLIGMSSNQSKLLKRMNEWLFGLIFSTVSDEKSAPLKSRNQSETYDSAVIIWRSG